MAVAVLPPHPRGPAHQPARPRKTTPLQRDPPEETALHDQLMRFPRTNHAVMRPHRTPHPFPLLLDLRVRVMNKLTNPCERLAPPVPQVLDLLRDVLRSHRAVRSAFRL